MKGTMSAAPTDTAEEQATSHAVIPDIMASLPLAPAFPPYPHRHYCGFWLPEFFLKGLAAVHARFQPRPSDVFLATFPKSGTTWLKALAFAARNRAAHPPSAGDHPLRRSNPHDCVVGFLEMGPNLVDSDCDAYNSLPSPRVLATHLPHSLLPRRVTVCRIVYVCREPKDTFVSFWHFHQKTTATIRRLIGAPASTPMPTFEEAFELFCEGRCQAGLQWRQALEFWEASRRAPGKVLFLRYEDMLQDTAGSLRELAAFMGCAFSPEEDQEAGVIHDVVELCSFDKLKGMDVNKNGSTVVGLKNESYFRKGAVGDWKNYMMPAMAARLDRVVQEALQGSTLTFGASK